MKMRTLVTCLSATLMLLGCENDDRADCRNGDSMDPVPSCSTVCTHLFSLECRVGSGVDECIRVCGQSGAITDFPQVMHCYQAAKSCDDVNACSRGCGPDNMPVPFNPIMSGGDAATDQDGG